MGNGSGQRWVVGTIANGYILTMSGTWVPLNEYASPHGPWWEGDVVNDAAFTGAAWVPLPPCWRPDPAGKHQSRWWTGHSWSERVISDDSQFSRPPAPSVSPTEGTVQPRSRRESIGFWGFVDRFAFTGWVCFWLIVAVGSAWVAWQERQPRLLWLTATASANVFAYKLTGRSWKQVQKSLRKVPYMICGVVAAAGVWLSLHFDDPDVLKVALIVVLIGLIVSWVIG